MSHGQLLKGLPEECLLNISSFLLGKPHEIKLKYSNKFREIQHKNGIEIEEIEKSVRIIDNVIDVMFTEESHPVRVTKYGYEIKSKGYSFETALRIFKRQSKRLSEMIKSYGNTSIEVEFSLYNRNNSLMKSIFDITCSPLMDDEDIEEELGRQIYHIEHYINVTNSGNCRFNGMKFKFENRVLHVE